jgi:hypothetical protein
MSAAFEARICMTIDGGAKLEIKPLSGFWPTAFRGDVEQNLVQL